MVVQSPPASTPETLTPAAARKRRGKADISPTLAKSAKPAKPPTRKVDGGTLRGDLASVTITREGCEFTVRRGSVVQAELGNGGGIDNGTVKRISVEGVWVDVEDKGDIQCYPFFGITPTHGAEDGSDTTVQLHFPEGHGHAGALDVLALGLLKRINALRRDAYALFAELEASRCGLDYAADSVAVESAFNVAEDGVLAVIPSIHEMEYRGESGKASTRKWHPLQTLAAKMFGLACAADEIPAGGSKAAKNAKRLITELKEGADDLGEAAGEIAEAGPLTGLTETGR